MAQLCHQVFYLIGDQEILWLQKQNSTDEKFMLNTHLCFTLKSGQDIAKVFLASVWYHNILVEFGMKKPQPLGKGHSNQFQALAVTGVERASVSLSPWPLAFPCRLCLPGQPELQAPAGVRQSQSQRRSWPITHLIEFCAWRPIHNTEISWNHNLLCPSSGRWSLTTLTWLLSWKYSFGLYLEAVWLGW